MKDRLLASIRSGGPMPFEEFTTVALYDRTGGFFGSGKLRSERPGDFLTSPEVSSLFGETLAAYVAAEHARIGDPFLVVDAGAGSGSLLGAMLEQIDVAVAAVEVSPAARNALGDLLPPAAIHEDMPSRIRGVVIANELIDNLPMALAQRVDGTWRERFVGVDGEGLGLVDADARPEVIDWLDRFGGEALDGDWVEVQLAATDWLCDTLRSLEAGSVVIIDYGDTAEGLQPRRRDGTLRTYRSHHLGPHPLDEPGETDITSDVNFSALLAVAGAEGGECSLLRQEEFLSGLGLRDTLSRLRRDEMEAARSGDEFERLRLRTLKTEAETLLHPRGLGDFRVLVVRK